MLSSCSWCSLLTWSAQLAGTLAQLAVARQQSAKGRTKIRHLTAHFHALWNALAEITDMLRCPT